MEKIFEIIATQTITSFNLNFIDTPNYKKMVFIIDFYSIVVKNSNSYKANDLPEIAFVQKKSPE
jgi:hypothetical protein